MSLVLSRRFFATSAIVRQHFIILGYDGRDPDALNRRMAARDAHVKRAQEAKDAGKLLTAAAMLNESETMCGSALTVDFPDRKAVDAWLKDEPYVTGKVWERIDVIPVRIAPLK